MNYLFTVCGRAGSKGLKNKNLKAFLGVPLLYYTLAAIDFYAKHNADKTIHVALNTDSDELVELARVWNSDINIVSRAPELAGDSAAKLPVIQDTFYQMEAMQGIKYDCIIDLDITSPLRTLQDIEAAIDSMKSNGFDVVFSVTEARRNPYFNMVKLHPDGGCEKVIESNYTARQQSPAIYDMNASIYVYNPSFLRTNTSGMLFDGACGFIEMPDTGILDIDSERDFLLMEAIAAHLKMYDTGLRAMIDHAHTNRGERI
jgi:CMP-N,N'-diacetyllegionaminic acid synthase